MFIGIVIVAVLIILLLIIYLTIRFHKFNLINKINNKYLSWVVSFIPALIFLIFFIIDRINTFVVLFHLSLIWMILDLIFVIIKLISKKESKYYLSGIFTIIIVSIYLIYGYYLAHHVVQTNYEVTANKDIGVENFRIAQISDSHIGATMDGDDFIIYMEKINEVNPDIVVVTGDFVDDDTSYEDMVKGCTGLGKLSTKYGVYFIYGNHDKGYFTYRTYDDNDLREHLKENNVTILEDEYIDITNNICLIGRQDKSELERESAINLTKGIDKTKYIIALDHQPNDYDNETKAGIDLVLSGHTHGGQLFPLGQLGVKVGINDRFYGIEKRDNTTFIVNSGIGDWAIKFKTGTISEYTVIDIKTR